MSYPEAQLYPRFSKGLIDYWRANNVVGRSMVNIITAASLAQVIRSTNGDHIEIGSQWGGSALVAGWAMEENKEGRRIWCIDSRPDLKLFTSNLKSKPLVHIVQALSYPFPLDARFSTGFIDADHSYAWALQDWITLSARVNRYILSDDISKPEVYRMVRQAMWSEEWQLAEYIWPHVAVFSKVRIENEHTSALGYW